MGCGGTSFWFSLKISKKLVRKMHRYGFFSKISNVKLYFCQVHWIPCFLPQPGMFSLALYPNQFQELWLIITSAPKFWRARDLKSFWLIGLIQWQFICQYDSHTAHSQVHYSDQWWKNLFQSGRAKCTSKNYGNFFNETIYFNNRPNTNCVA